MLQGFIPPDRYFAYLSWTEIRDLPDKANVVLVQPLGAIEQHGPHLPLAVDSAIAQGILGQALAQLDPAIPAYALPTQMIGKSNEHWHFPGTLSLSAATLGAVLTETAESLYRAGFRKLVFANAHGGQPQVLEIVARDLHQRYGDLWIFPFFVWNVPHSVEELLSPRELKEGIHGGDAETSLLLSLLPDTVKMEAAIAEYPDNRLQAGLISLEGKLPVSWVTRDISHSGVVGDATVATRDKGDRILADLAQGWVQALTAVHRFHPSSPPSPDCSKSLD
ncbi:MAG: creatininase family protein [Synechococcales cyanobacterium RM1_1_8]|nr:creatininase family protein [Synechococcales cyanobacterium RM1_1_8]